MNRVSEVSGRVIRKEVRVDASIEKVWKAWTTNDGATMFFAPKAKIELVPGGRYELYFDLQAPKGSRGWRGLQGAEFSSHGDPVVRVECAA